MNKQKVIEEFIKEVNGILKEREVLLDIGYDNINSYKDFKELGFTYMPLSTSYSKDVILSNLSLLPLSNNYAQILFCHSGFENTLSPLDTLKEFRRVIKAGGYLFMITPHVCKDNIFNKNKESLFVLNEMQLGRLLYSSGFVPLKIYILKEGEEEKDWFIVTIANVM